MRVDVTPSKVTLHDISVGKFACVARDILTIERYWQQSGAFGQGCHRNHVFNVVELSAGEGEGR